MDAAASLDPLLFRRKLKDWYRLHARKLPWRGLSDPYAIWVSEVMLQQTRVAAVIEHYRRFLSRFPTLSALAVASESDVLAAWSGLGYYRRARMMHRAAQVVHLQMGGKFPTTSTGLLLLPGIGEYTSAAIASIAFGESIAVLDGNVERVLLRLTGRAEDATAAGKAFLRHLAAQLVPPANPRRGHVPGDHNQAMMELGATLCLPRAPLCLQCPVYDLCRTRGEHPIPLRLKSKKRAVAYLFSSRGPADEYEVLLTMRSVDTSLMAGMYELPPLPLDVVASHEPKLQLRHSITDTLYTVHIYADQSLVAAIPVATGSLGWHPAAKLNELPLTGLARKALRRLQIMS